MSDLVERLLDADWNSQQRFLGSRIFGEAADRISQQDAELERVRRELAEAEKKFETADKLRVFWNDKATELAGKVAEARKAAFIEAGQKALEWAAHYSPASDGRNTFVLFSEWAEAKAEETRT